MKNISINTEFITLSQFLKHAGIAGTGGHAKDIIVSGNVLVNGEICLMRGKKLYPSDIISFNGEEMKVICT
jgi:ribosome-associated protein